MPKIDLVIFDFDGTLVDTAPDIVRATNLFLQSKGLEPLTEARIRSEIGLGLKKLILELYPEDQITPALEQSVYDEFTAIYEKEFLQSPRLFDGAYEFLTEWEGQIAIVSNKRMRFIEPILRHLSLDSLPWVKVIGGDTFTNMKPHPEPFMAAIAAADCSPEETLIVGDGIPDVQGAQAIGSLCVAVDFGYHSSQHLLELGAWKNLPSFSDLRTLIASIT